MATQQILPTISARDDDHHHTDSDDHTADAADDPTLAQNEFDQNCAQCMWGDRGRWFSFCLLKMSLIKTAHSACGEIA
jgi:hypothetical protein